MRILAHRQSVMQSPQWRENSSLGVFDWLIVLRNLETVEFIRNLCLIFSLSENLFLFEELSVCHDYVSELRLCQKFHGIVSQSD